MSDKNTPQELPSWISDHVSLYLEDPDAGHDWDSTFAGGPGILPTLLLTTTGRKSGQLKTTPLIYHRSDDSFVVIASKGGAPAHPAWYLNLIANRDSEVLVRRERHRVVPRTAEGQEREALWEKLAEIYPPYNDYQAATERKIPVVVLEVTE